MRIFCKGGGAIPGGLAVETANIAIGRKIFVWVVQMAEKCLPERGYVV